MAFETDTCHFMKWVQFWNKMYTCSSAKTYVHTRSFIFASLKIPKIEMKFCNRNFCGTFAKTCNNNNNKCNNNKIGNKADILQNNIQLQGSQFQHMISQRRCRRRRRRRRSHHYRYIKIVFVFIHF